MSDDQVYEWVKLFGEWSKSLEEITLRLSTRKGIPEIDIPVTSCHPESLRTPPPLKRKPPVKLPTEEEEEEVILPLRTVLWKHFFFKPSSAFARFFPPGVTNTATRRVFYQVILQQFESLSHTIHRSHSLIRIFTKLVLRVITRLPLKKTYVAPLPPVTMLNI